MDDRTSGSDQPAPPDEYVSVESRNGVATMTVRCDMASLRHLRRELDTRLASILEPARRSEFLVAVNEAVTNAIESQQRNDVFVPIIVTIDRLNRVVIVDDHARAPRDAAADRSPGIDRAAGALEIPEQGLPPPSTHRGRGMHIMRAICPDVRIVPTEVGHSVVLPVT